MLNKCFVAPIPIGHCVAFQDTLACPGPSNDMSVQQSVPQVQLRSACPDTLLMLKMHHAMLNPGPAPLLPMSTHPNTHTQWIQHLAPCMHAILHPACLHTSCSLAVVSSPSSPQQLPIPASPPPQSAPAAVSTGSPNAAAAAAAVRCCSARLMRALSGTRCQGGVTALNLIAATSSSSTSDQPVSLSLSA